MLWWTWFRKVCLINMNLGSSLGKSLDRRFMLSFITLQSSVWFICISQESDLFLLFVSYEFFVDGLKPVIKCTILNILVKTINQDRKYAHDIFTLFYFLKSFLHPSPPHITKNKSKNSNRTKQITCAREQSHIRDWVVRGNTEGCETLAIDRPRNGVTLSSRRPPPEGI